MMPLLQIFNTKKRVIPLGVFIVPGKKLFGAVPRKFRINKFGGIKL